LLNYVTQSWETTWKQEIFLHIQIPSFLEAAYLKLKVVRYKKNLIPVWHPRNT
jgi:hypothetical protein